MMFDSRQKFKDRLNMALSIREMRPKDLATRTGLSEATISQYRSGYTEPKTDKLALIARVLNVNPTWLLGLNVPIEMQITSRDLSDRERELITAFNSSSIDTQNAVCAILGIKKSDTDSDLSKVAN